MSRKEDQMKMNPAGAKASLPTSAMGRVFKYGLGLVFASLLASGCSGGASGVEGSGGALLASQEQRITDQVIRGDVDTIRSFYKRIEQINTNGLDNKDYHLTKARNWVDFAHDEYTDNDRSIVVEAALEQALFLIQRMESGDKQITMNTPIIETSRRLRPDLWEISEIIKNNPVGFPCAQATIAELEVALVWAGHEYNELGWRHAVPEIDRAERLARQAFREAESCARAPIVPIPVSPAVCPTNVCDCSQCIAPTVPVYEVEAIEATGIMPKRVHFALDKSNLSAESRQILDEVAYVMDRYPSITLLLEGHTDPQASDAYNQRLSERRSRNVRSYLIDRGVDPARLDTSAVGERSLLRPGCNPLDHAFNRRVEFIVVSGAGNITQVERDDDLQIQPGQAPNCVGNSRRR